MKYEVQYTKTITKTAKCVVEASSREEAIEKVKKGDIVREAEDVFPEELLATGDFCITDEEDRDTGLWKSMLNIKK